MAQAGIHGLVGIAMKKLPIKKEWLLLGVVLGNMLPDLDALVVAFVTLSGGDTHGLHRTWQYLLRLGKDRRNALFENSMRDSLDDRLRSPAQHP